MKGYQSYWGKIDGENVGFDNIGSSQDPLQYIDKSDVLEEYLSVSKLKNDFPISIVGYKGNTKVVNIFRYFTHFGNDSSRRPFHLVHMLLFDNIKPVNGAKLAAHFPATQRFVEYQLNMLPSVEIPDDNSQVNPIERDSLSTLIYALLNENSLVVHYDFSTPEIKSFHSLKEVEINHKDIFELEVHKRLLATLQGLPDVIAQEISFLFGFSGNAINEIEDFSIITTPDQDLSRQAISNLGVKTGYLKIEEDQLLQGFSFHQSKKAKYLAEKFEPPYDGLLIEFLVFAHSIWKKRTPKEKINRLFEASYLHFSLDEIYVRYKREVELNVEGRVILSSLRRQFENFGLDTQVIYGYVWRLFEGDAGLSAELRERMSKFFLLTLLATSEQVLIEDDQLISVANLIRKDLDTKDRITASLLNFLAIRLSGQEYKHLFKLHDKLIWPFIPSSNISFTERCILKKFDFQVKRNERIPHKTAFKLHDYFKDSHSERDAQLAKIIDIQNGQKEDLITYCLQHNDKNLEKADISVGFYELLSLKVCLEIIQQIDDLNRIFKELIRTYLLSADYTFEIDDLAPLFEIIQKVDSVSLPDIERKFLDAISEDRVEESQFKKLTSFLKEFKTTYSFIPLINNLISKTKTARVLESLFADLDFELLEGKVSIKHRFIQNDQIDIVKQLMLTRAFFIHDDFKQYLESLGKGWKCEEVKNILEYIASTIQDQTECNRLTGLILSGRVDNEGSMKGREDLEELCKEFYLHKFAESIDYKVKNELVEKIKIGFGNLSVSGKRSFRKAITLSEKDFPGLIQFLKKNDFDLDKITAPSRKKRGIELFIKVLSALISSIKKKFSEPAIDIMKISSWGALFVAIVLMIALIIYQYIQNPGFREMGQKEYYTSKNQPGLGYIGKVNSLVEKYLQNYGNTDSISASNSLDHYFHNLYPSLKFYVPIGGEVSDIRFVGFRSLTGEDSIFYYNSFLKQHIESQIEYPSSRIFNIEFRTTEIENPTITNITIDPGLIRTRLSGKPWEGVLVARPVSLIQNYPEIKIGNIIFPMIPFNVGTPRPIEIDLRSFRSQQDLSEWLFNYEGLKKRLSDRNSYKLGYSDEQHLAFRAIKNANVSDKYLLQAQAHNMRIKLISSDTAIDLSQLNVMTPKFDTIPSNDYDIVGLGEWGAINLKSTMNVLSFPVRALPHNNKVITRSNPSKSNNDKFIKQVNNNLSLSFSKDTQFDTLALSLKPILSAYVEGKLNRYYEKMILDKELPDPEQRRFALAMTLMNLSSGEVLAAPFIYDKDLKLAEEDMLVRRNVNFVNHNIGSTFKPLLANAILHLHPQIHNFTLQLDQRNVSSCLDSFTSLSQFVDDVGEENYLPEMAPKVNLLGYRLKTFARTSNRGLQGNQISFDDFLKFSSNTYPVALTLMSLTELSTVATENTHPQNILNELRSFQDISRINRNGLFRENLENSNFLNQQSDPENLHLSGRSFYNSNLVQSLTHLYQIRYHDVYYKDNDESREDEIISLYDTTGWAGLNITNSGYLLPEVSSLRTDIMTKRQEFRTEVVPWILGASSNRWNNIKLAEAYSRMITRKNVKQNFLLQEYNQNEYNTINHYNSWRDYAVSRLSLSGMELATSQELDSALNHLLMALKNTASSYGFISKIDSAERQLKTDGFLSDTEGLVLLAKTGTPDEIEGNELNLINNYGDKKVQQQGLLVFCLMTESAFESLLNHGIVIPNAGITGVMYISYEYFGPNAKQHPQQIISRDAKNFIDKDFIEALVLLNPEIFKPQDI